MTVAWTRARKFRACRNPERRDCSSAACRSAGPAQIISTGGDVPARVMLANRIGVFGPNLDHDHGPHPWQRQRRAVMTDSTCHGVIRISA